MSYYYYEPHLVLYKTWLLYWKSQFNEALELLEELDKWEKASFVEYLHLFKSLLLLKLDKYDEAESVYDGRKLDLLHSLSLSFIKFMKHDLPGAKELLKSWKMVEGVRNILDYVCLYEVKLCDFNQKKNSSSMNQRHEVSKSLKECVEMKTMIIEMYDDYFRHHFCFILSFL